MQSRRWIVPAVLAAAVAAPAAQASALHATRPDDRAGIRGAGVVAVSRTMRPDDRAGIRGPGGPLAVPAAVHTDGTGFDWRDAAIGGAAALALALGMGATVISLRRRNAPKAA